MYLSSGNLSVDSRRHCEKVCKDLQWNIPNPRSLDEMGLRVEIVVYCDLDEVARQSGATCEEDLGSAG